MLAQACNLTEIPTYLSLSHSCAQAGLLLLHRCLPAVQLAAPGSAVLLWSTQCSPVPCQLSLQLCLQLDQLLLLLLLSVCKQSLGKSSVTGQTLATAEHNV